MGPSFTPAVLQQILGTPHPNNTLAQAVGSISIDTRTLQPGDLFVALRGENFDGHDFAAQAVEKGAIALVVDQPLDLDVTQFVVPQTLKAYQALAQWWRQQFTIPVIAVTGSVGKTTTKELISGVLGSQGQVLKTEANHNNEIGLPKTLLQLKSHHDFAVVEMGMRGPGEIAELTQIAQPTIGLITNVGTAHIGRLGSREAIAQAKCELFAHLNPQGVGIFAAGNPLLDRTVDQVWSGRRITYGWGEGELRGTLLTDQQITINHHRFHLPLPGKHNALNFLGAIAVAQALAIPLDQLPPTFTLAMPSGRSQRLTLPGDVVVLDETYNAGLESMVAALDLLKETPGQRHIAVLGAMKELGEAGPEIHRQVGAKVQDLGLNQLLVLANDPLAREMAIAAPRIPQEIFTTHQGLIQYIQTHQQPGDRYLFKASNSVGLNQVVQGLMAGISA